jgi:hypothetical protein
MSRLFRKDCGKSSSKPSLSVVPCSDIPHILTTDRRACETIARDFPDCCCESESVSPQYSPAIVGPEETIVRLILREWWDEETRKASPAAFAHVAKNGMSTTRVHYCTKDEIAAQETSRDHHRSEQRDYVGYLSVVAQEIRIIHDQQKAFAIYDTALGPIGTNRAHADVCQAVLRPGSKAIELRRILQEIFNRKGLSTARDGAIAVPTLTC